MEDLHHAPTPIRRRAPPRLKPPRPAPQAPLWDDLLPVQRGELLRLLGRMLTERLDRDDARGEEVAHDRR
ncbi:MAG: hypothetical protein JO355_02585 [Planctomycetaceae bacterium]|nr:hypothetical protein [Planctomycetaceae bacterium]